MDAAEEARGRIWDHLWQGKKCLSLWAAAVVVYGLFLWAGLVFLSPVPFLLCLGLGALEDWDTGYISDGWSLLLAVTGLLSAWDRQQVADSLLSAALCFFIYALLYMVSRKSLGTGDILLSTGAAFWLAPVSCLFFIWFSAALAALSLGIVLLAGGRGFCREVRFGPFIALGGVAAYGLEKTGLISILAAWFLAG